MPFQTSNFMGRKSFKDGPFDIQGEVLRFFLTTSYFFLFFCTTSYFFKSKLQQVFYFFEKITH